MKYWVISIQTPQLDHTFRVGKIEITTSRIPLSSSLNDMYKNIALAESDFYISEGIDCVLGIDVYHRLLLLGTIIKTGQLSATNTIFGYVISEAFVK